MFGNLNQNKEIRKESSDSDDGELMDNLLSQINSKEK